MNIPTQHNEPTATAVGRPREFRHLLTYVAFALLALAGLFVLGYWPRAERARRADSTAKLHQSALPTVRVVRAVAAPAETEIELPGNIQALMETALFARADGYVQRIMADIGDYVKPGQLLAEIESPEMDQQILEARANFQRSQSALRQAEAALSQAKADLGLAEITAQRWLVLVDKGVLSKQDGDEKRAALAARQADVMAAEAAVQAARESMAASEATLQRLMELQAFRQVRAPFPGVITARNIDLGSLVSAGSSSSVRELFRLAQIETLRVFVNVPQSEFAGIKTGLPCSVEVAEYQGRIFEGRVTRTSSALEPASRTLLTEIRIDNPSRALLPGMYAAVRFRIQQDRPRLLIPSSAFRNTEKGPVVAVLHDHAVVRLQPVSFGRDYGTQIEVVKGLNEGQELIADWTDGVREGATVNPVSKTKTALPAKGDRVK